MKILFCLNKDIFSLIALNKLLPSLIEEKHSFSVVMTDKIGKQTAISDITIIEKIIPFEGILSVCEKLSCSGKYLTFSQISQKYHLSLYNVTTINNDFGYEMMRQHDIVISIRFGSIFKRHTLGYAKNVILNLHSAILPDYRGVLGTFRALSDGCSEIGTTLHLIGDDTIDTGDIIEITHISANYNKSLFSNIMALYDASIFPLQKIIKKISLEEKIIMSSQDNNAGRYFSNPTLEEIEYFKKNTMPIYSSEDINYLINLFTED